MRRFTQILIFPAVALLLSVSTATAALWSDDVLVTIDGTKYTTEDFKRWWQFWNDTDMDLPEKPETYIDWLLLAREGESMKLDEDPSFQHSTEVFLKVRSLLMLQKEEVYDKIDISQNEIRARYQELYTPIWYLERLQFDNEQAARTAWQELQEGSVSIEELEARPVGEGGPTSVREDWRRPIGINEYWSDLFKKLEVGQATEPVKDLDFYVLYYLKIKENGDEADYEKLRDTIRNRIFQEKRDELTGELLARLRKKYEVKVNEELLAELDLEAPDETYGDEPVITTNYKNVTEKQFMAILRKDLETRQQAHSAMDQALIKDRVVNGIINQNLTDWEALNRQYEKFEPLKWEYLFNYKHRLTNAVQQRLFSSEATASEEEIENYYKENLSKYTQPEVVDLVLVDDTDGAVDIVWGEVAAGKDFYQAVRENTEQKTATQSIPSQHLEPDVQEVVSKLSEGETSQPFTSQGRRFIVYLVKRTPAKPLPLKQVAPSIRASIIKEKTAQKREEYLDLVKSRSNIKINEANWKALQKELGGSK